MEKGPVGMTASKTYMCPNEEAYFRHIREAELALEAELDSVECRPGSYPCMVSIVYRHPPQKSALVVFEVPHARRLLEGQPGTGDFQPQVIPSQLRTMLQNVQESLRYQLANSVAITRMLDEAGLCDRDKMKKYFAIVLSEIDARTVSIPDSHGVDSILARATGDSRGTTKSDDTDCLSRGSRADAPRPAEAGEGKMPNP